MFKRYLLTENVFNPLLNICMCYLSHFVLSHKLLSLLFIVDHLTVVVSCYVLPVLLCQPYSNLQDRPVTPHQKYISG